MPNNFPFFMFGSEEVLPKLSLLEVHIGTHTARHSERGSYSRQCGHNQLKNQLPSIRFISCAHNRKFFKVNNFWREEGLLFFTKEFKSLRVFV